MLLGVGVGLGIGGWFWYDYYNKMNIKIQNMETIGASAGMSSVDTSNESLERTLALIAAITSWTMCGLWMCVICCCYHKINLIIHIIKASARFINSNLCILLVPIFNTLAAMCAFVLWSAATIYLYSCGTFAVNTDYPVISTVTRDQNGEGMFWFNVLFVLWLLAFILMLNVFVIAAAAVIWYFQQGATDCGQENAKVHNPCYQGYCWAFGKHMGSVAFGAFILAVVWLLQIILAYMHKKMRDSGATSNKCIECAMRYAAYCLACFERCIQFLNKMAFIQIALTGRCFCIAAKNGFILALSHMMEFSLLSLIGGFFAFVGKLVVASGAFGLGLLCYTQIPSLEESVSSIWIPIICLAIFGYVIGSLFASVYLVACYAILQCFYTDVELSKGNGKAPRYTPHELQSFVVDAQKP